MPIANDTPLEVIAAPFEAWLAPTATAMPAIGESPANPWAKIGTNGAHNYTDDGVTIELNQTLAFWRGLLSTGPRKVFRTEESLRIAFAVADLTLEQFATIMNDNDITTVAAGAADGHKAIGLMRGLSVKQYALLLRGPSPYVSGLNMQFELPIVVHDGQPKPKFSRDGKPAELAFEFQSLIDTSQATEDLWFGVLRAAHAAATS
jgi:hypothetical protein